MKILKKNLSTEERIEFVNNVYDLCEINDQYEPAIYEYAFRINVLIFFTDIDTEGKTQEDLNNIAFSNEAENVIYKDQSIKSTVIGLSKACREKIEMMKTKKNIEYQCKLNNKIWEMFGDILNNFANTIDPKEVMKKVLEDRENNNQISKV